MRQKIILILFFVMAYQNNINAQEKIVLGNHVKNGKGNTNMPVVKGGGIGVKIKAGKKEIKVESIEINLLENHPDSLKFYVRIFPLNDKNKKSIVPDKMYSQVIKNNKISIDLTELNLIVSGDVMVGLEWAESAVGYNNKIYFPSALFTKGFYYKDEDDGAWKKMPLFGLDMELHGTVLLAAN